MNLFSHFRTCFPSDPARTFIEEADGTRLSYSELLERTGRLANLFLSWGVKPGDRIAVQVDKSVPALLVYLASLRAGAVYLPLNP
ncbi:MAG: malonyl-CoA synthase, partial [Alphaproteobacteria bacterium]|nr:malonyl-CoA synthase [Alphaproteobacteria bacterium]